MGSLPNHENRNIFDGTPHQGTSEARRAGVSLNCLLRSAAGGTLGGGGNLRKWRSV